MDDAVLSHDSEQPLAGRKIYSPVVIAGYAIFACLPAALILYGLNVKTRGQRGLGLGMLSLGITCLVLLAFVPGDETVPSENYRAIGMIGALTVYGLEKGPFERAVRQGAGVARWWLPGLLLLLGFSMIVLTEPDRPTDESDDGDRVLEAALRTRERASSSENPPTARPINLSTQTSTNAPGSASNPPPSRRASERPQVSLLHDRLEW